VFIEAKDDGGGGDNWSYKLYKAPIKSSPPTNQHPVFYKPNALPDTSVVTVQDFAFPVGFDRFLSPNFG